MQQENKESVTKKDLSDLQKSITQTIQEIKTFIMDGFTGLNKKIDHVEKHLDTRMDKVEEKMDGLEGRLDDLENKMDRRMSVTEDRVRVVKNIIEKDLKTKVAW